MLSTTAKLLLAASLALFSVGSINAAAPAQDGLDAPATACWHEPSKSWFVSNMGGGVSFAQDGNGSINRFDEDGNRTGYLIAGIDSPTGLATTDTSLFIVDRTMVLEASIGSYAFLNRWTIPDPGMPNGIAIAKDGMVYVADTAKNRIYRIVPGGTPMETWVEDPILEGPNALLMTKKYLIVGTWGPDMNPETFATSRPGTLMKINLKTKAITPYGKGEPIGNIDGLAKVEDDLFVTDWTGGRLLKVDDDGEVEVVLSGLPMVASLGYSPSMETIMLPVMSTNSLVTLNLDAIED